MKNKKIVDSKNVIKCPKCHKESFTPLKYESSTKIINPFVGKCSECGYDLTANEFITKRHYLLGSFAKGEQSNLLLEIGKRGFTLYSKGIVDSKFMTSTDIEINPLYKYVVNHYAGKEDSEGRIIDKARIYDTFALYGVETSTLPYRFHATIFWYITSADEKLSFRIMHFEEDGHKSENDKQYPITKSLIVDSEGKGKYCLFGRNLCTKRGRENKDVCIVESEKSAIIAALFYPQANWMAAGSCYFLKGDKLEYDYVDDAFGEKGTPIDHNKVILFPDPDLRFETDTNWYAYPSTKKFSGCRVCKFMEDFAIKHLNEKFPYSTDIVKESFDIADYIEFQTQSDERVATYDKLISCIDSGNDDEYNQITKYIKRNLICSSNTFKEVKNYFQDSTNKSLTEKKEYYSNIFKIIQRIKDVFDNYHVYVADSLNENKRRLAFPHIDISGRRQCTLRTSLKSKSNKVMIPENNDEYCLFGEHLLGSREYQEKNNLIIVDSDHYALIGSCVFPDIVWLSREGLEQELNVADRIRGYYSGSIFLDSKNLKIVSLLETASKKFCKEEKKKNRKKIETIYDYLKSLVKGYAPYINLSEELLRMYE